MSLPVAPLALSDEDRAELRRLLGSGSSRMAERARIVLACGEPSAGGNSGVAAELGLATDTVRKWRERFARDGLPGLADGARPGRPKAGLVLTDAERDQLRLWARRGKTSQVLALHAEDRAGLRRGQGQQAGRRRAADH
jgi:transposase